MLELADGQGRLAFQAGGHSGHKGTDKSVCRTSLTGDPAGDRIGARWWSAGHMGSGDRNSFRPGIGAAA